jgi:hypothetical protein
MPDLAARSVVEFAGGVRRKACPLRDLRGVRFDRRVEASAEGIHDLEWG